MQDDFFTSPLPDRSNVSSLRNVDADTGDSLGTDLLRLLELSPPSSTFGTKLCRNISFPNRPRLSVRPSIRLHGAPAAAAAAAEGKSGNRRAGGRRVVARTPVAPSSEPWSATRRRVSWRSSGRMAWLRLSHFCTVPCSRHAHWALNIAFRSQFAPHHRTNGHHST